MRLDLVFISSTFAVTFSPLSNSIENSSVVYDVMSSHLYISVSNDTFSQAMCDSIQTSKVELNAMHVTVII